LKTYPLADQLVCLDDDADRIWVLNPVAALMLEYTRRGLDHDAIARLISERYQVHITTVMSDLKQFDRMLVSQDALAQEAYQEYTPLTDFEPARDLRPTETQTYYLPGYSLRVSSEAEGLHDYLRDMFTLSPCTQLDAQDLIVDIYHDVDSFPIVVDGKTLDTGFTLADTAIKCLREINGLVARSHNLTIIFHASAVAAGDTGILIPALGGSGKTTLAAYLMHRGYAFLNDDAVPMLAKSAELLPVPVSLSIKSGSWEVLGKHYPEMTRLTTFGEADRQIKYLPPSDHQIQQKPVACKLVIIPEYRESQHEVEVVQLSVVEVFSHIIRSGCIVERPVNPVALGSLVDWLDEMPCYRIVYSSLLHAEAALSALLDEIKETHVCSSWPNN